MRRVKSWFRKVFFKKDTLRLTPFLISFGLIGTITLLFSFAATETNSIQPENGSLSGNVTTGTDGTNGFVKFQNCQMSCSGNTVWKPLKIGAGGYNTGIDMSPDGSTMVIRTDTYGAYRWVGTTWQQLVTHETMPAGFQTTDTHGGVLEIAIAPSNPNRFYMAFAGYVFVSDNKGDTWVKSGFPQHKMDANDGPRTNGRKMVVDPSNPDIAYFGTPDDGLFYTINGGISWTKISESSVPKASSSDSGSFAGMAFDKSGGTTGGKTNNLYVASYGHGIYKTTDAGSNWQSISGPSMINRGSVASDGNYYVVTGDNGQAVWVYRSGAWVNISPAENHPWHSVAIDPHDAAHIVVTENGGTMAQTTNRGSSWTIASSHPRAAADIPWLAWTDENYMSNGDTIFDATTTNKLWYAEGIGTWYGSLANGATSITWNSQNTGIEQLVVNEILAPPGGKPLVAVWDRGEFQINNPDTYPAQHGPSSRFNASWGLDYSLQDAKFLVANTSDNRGDYHDGNSIEAGYSTDGGTSWQKFASVPTGTTDPYTYGFGDIAVSSPSNIIWAPANGKLPYYTKDKGASWQPVNLPGLNTADSNQMNGFDFAYYLIRHFVVSDKVTAGTFYLYNDVLGLYSTTDGGSTWALIHSGEIANFSNFNATLKAVPGNAGQLFFTSGDAGGQSGAFMRSSDGGKTWVTVTSIGGVRAFGFGKAASSTNYPAIYAAGFINNIYGIYRSTDNAASWIKIGDYPLGSLDIITTIEGNKDVYGTVYIGHGGSGAAYGTLQ